MDKKAFMANNIIFIISAIFVFMSVKHLGSNNLMVGITGIFLLIAIVNKDFSRNPLRAILKISFLTAFIAFAPYLVNLNIYSGLIINFLVVFIMIYLIVYTLNKTIYFPFLFGYTLLLTTNVSGKNLYMRIIGLVVVGVVAVIFQIGFTKVISKKKEKNKILINIIEALIDSIDGFKPGNLKAKSRDRLKELSTQWSRDILEKRNNSFYLKHIENVELNLIAEIEKLDRVSEEISKEISTTHIYQEFLDDLKQVLFNLKLYLKNREGASKLNLSVEKIDEYYSAVKLTDIKIYEAIEAIKVIEKLVDDLSEIESEKKDYIEIKFGMKEIREIKNLLVSDFNKNSVRFIFAFRTATLVSLAYFSTQYFHLELGKWMVFTITSVSQPYNDTVRGRAKGRLFGTIAGVVIYLPLSYIFTSVESRVIIVSIAVYLMISFKKYAYSIAMLTVLFLGVVTIDIQNILLFAENRVLFVALGIIIVLLGNKFIFPYSLKKETKILIDKYYSCCNEILEKTLLLYKQNGIREEIRNLIITAHGIENKILLNNTGLDSDIIREFRNESRRLLNNINNVLNRVEYLDNDLKRNGYERMNMIAKMKKEIEEKNKEEISEEILEKYITPVKKTSEKLIYIDIYEMIVARSNCMKIKKELVEKI